MHLVPVSLHITVAGEGQLKSIQIMFKVLNWSNFYSTLILNIATLQWCDFLFNVFSFGVLNED